MPRRSRCLLPGIPCHITQRRVDRRETFSSVDDRNAYLELLRQNLADTETRLRGWCLMTNHVHLIAVPEHPDSLSIASMDDMRNTTTPAPLASSTCRTIAVSPLRSPSITSR